MYVKRLRSHSHSPHSHGGCGMWMRRMGYSVKYFSLKRSEKGRTMGGVRTRVSWALALMLTLYPGTASFGLGEETIPTQTPEAIESSVAANSEDAGRDQLASDGADSTAGDVATGTNVEDTEAEASEKDVTQEAAQDVAAEASQDTATEVVVAVSFTGPNSPWARVADIALSRGANAWDATELALERSGMTYQTGSEGAADVLVSLARDDTSTPCVMDLTSGSGWRLYVNGSYYSGSASTCELTSGDEIEWRYEAGTITVGVSVIGPGGTGLAYWISPTEVTVAANQSAWDASHLAFEQVGYTDGRLLSYSVSQDGSVELESLASLGSNGVTGEAWHVFVNGVPCEQNVAFMQLRAGDSICWYYVGNGTNGLPTFAKKTGAASQSPQTSVRLEGEVAQTQIWSDGEDENTSLADVLNATSGVSVSGSTGSRTLWTVKNPLSSSLDTLTAQSAWSHSLSRLLDEHLKSGRGGRATMGLDGGLYYLDDFGALVKLELS